MHHTFVEQIWPSTTGAAVRVRHSQGMQDSTAALPSWLKCQWCHLIVTTSWLKCQWCHLIVTTSWMKCQWCHRIVMSEQCCPAMQGSDDQCMMLTPKQGSAHDVVLWLGCRTAVAAGLSGW
jgi:hypothetical protein